MATRFVKDLADNPEAQEAVAAEAIVIEAENEGAAAAHALTSAVELHWARAAMFESVRLTCSPIVPHRATRDSKVGGYDIKKDTVVFINNHHMSFDEKYWGEGDTAAYMPERFLKQTT